VFEIVRYIYIFHLTWPTSLHYRVKRRCSKVLPNTGFITIRLLRFGIKAKRAYCRDNFFCLETTARHVFQQDSAPTHREHDTAAVECYLYQTVFTAVIHLIKPGFIR